MVEIDNKGHLELKDNVSQEDFKKYDLAQLEEHFVTLNQKVDQGIISINSELENIIDGDTKMSILILKLI